MVRRHPASTLGLDLHGGLDGIVGHHAHERPALRRVVLLGLAGQGPRAVGGEADGGAVGLIWAIPARLSSGIETAVAPELISPM